VLCSDSMALCVFQSRTKVRPLPSLNILGTYAMPWNNKDASLSKSRDGEGEFNEHSPTLCYSCSCSHVLCCMCVQLLLVSHRACLCVSVCLVRLTRWF